jgi:hypothetical protein
VSLPSLALKIKEICQMTSKKKPSKKRDPNQIFVAGDSDEDWAIQKARAVLRPTVQAASTIKEYGKAFAELDLNGLIDILTEQTKGYRYL